MEEKIRCNENHSVTIEGRENIVISGVTDMESFDEDCVVLFTTLGTLTLKGEDFKINKLNTDNGVVEIDGYINSFVYSSECSGQKSGSLFSRIFK